MAPAQWDLSALRLVDFSICPHVNGDGVPGSTKAEAEGWVASIDGPAYAVEDQRAFKVVGGEVKIILRGAGGGSPPKPQATAMAWRTAE